MSIDWKKSLLSVAQASSPRTQIAQVVEQAIDAGASVDDVRRFAASTPSLASVAALVQDGFFTEPAAKLAQSVVGGDAERKRGSSVATAGVKAHTVRADPTSSLPWFRRASMPTPPPSSLTTAGGPVTVDGERFDAADIAALLRAVA